MSYKKKTIRFPNAIEVEEYHTARYGAPGKKRSKKKEPTKEEAEKYNQYLREKKCRHKLRSNFDANDYFVTLTFRKDLRPESMEAAKKIYRKFIRAVQKAYRERGHPLKWIRNIEVGTKNAWHIHLVLNRIPDTDLIIREAWPHGRVFYELLYEKGEFRDLAAYMTKTPKTDPRLREASYSASRNLPVPKAEEKIITRWETWPETPKVRKGASEEWYIDPESFREGVNRFGYRYRSYTLLRYHRRN